MKENMAFMRYRLHLPRGHGGVQNQLLQASILKTRNYQALMGYFTNREWSSQNEVFVAEKWKTEKAGVALRLFFLFVFCLTESHD